MPRQDNTRTKKKKGSDSDKENSETLILRYGDSLMLFIQMQAFKLSVA